MDNAINSIVLASASPRRLELLRSLNLDVRVVPSTYEEPDHPHLSPRDLAIVHARHKCADVRGMLAGGGPSTALGVVRQAHDDNGEAHDDNGGRRGNDGRRVNGDLIVAADTVVDLDGVAYNKPSDPDDAKRMLRELSGRTHMVHTAFALAVPARDDVVEHCESTFVTFFPLDEAQIEDYVASKEPMDKAGAYGIQGYGATLVERIEGDFYTVMGFPLARFVHTLRRLGFLLPITNLRSTDRL